MAYLQEIKRQCRNSWCTKNAVVEVYDRWNCQRGSYCRKCGNQRKKELDALEEESFNGQT